MSTASRGLLMVVLVVIPPSTYKVVSCSVYVIVMLYLS